MACSMSSLKASPTRKLTKTPSLRTTGTRPSIAAPSAAAAAAPRSRAANAVCRRRRAIGLFAAHPEIVPSEKRSDRLHELVRVLEVAIDGGESHVGHLVQALELRHHELTDLGGGELLVGAVVETLLQLVHDRLEPGHGNRALLAGFEDPAHQFLAVEPLAPAVLFHHSIVDAIYPFIAREPPPAFQTLAAAPYGLAFLSLSLIDDLVRQMAAKRTFHLWFLLT